MGKVFSLYQVKISLEGNWYQWLPLVWTILTSHLLYLLNFVSHGYIFFLINFIEGLVMYSYTTSI